MWYACGVYGMYMVCMVCGVHDVCIVLTIAACGQRTGGQGYDRWRQVWLQPLVSVLTSFDCKVASNAASYVLPIPVKVVGWFA